MKIDICFPGNLQVDVRVGDHLIHTDQPTKAGGGDSGPRPFDLFLASIGTCSGFVAMQFCRQRGLSEKGMKMTLEVVRDDVRRRVGRLTLRLDLPVGFPEKYRAAILRAVDQCAVKRHILEPPELEVVLSEAEVPVA